MADIVGTISHPWSTTTLSLISALAHVDDPPEAARFAVGPPLAVLVTKILKRDVNEHRPRLFDRHIEQSFPSGHSTAITAFALSWLAARRTWRSLPLALGVIAAVNASRILRREHWLHDVLVGDAIGLGGAMLGELAARATARWLERRRQPAKKVADAPRGAAIAS